ncbi:hypothetical protein H9L39_08631 [Fusarium oxysporum f. sp. albedinis]|nr:hypothetical protein H9L39_08631 [Fusarium oxysporum f. sp. albedinis]
MTLVSNVVLAQQDRINRGLTDLVWRCNSITDKIEILIETHCATTCLGWLNHGEFYASHTKMLSLPASRLRAPGN